MMLVAFFSFDFSLGMMVSGLAASIVQVEDDERRFIVAVLAHALVQVLFRFDELDLHIHLARRLLDLGQEEQVVDKGEDARRLLLGSRTGSGSGSDGMNCLPKFWPPRPPRPCLCMVAVVVALGGPIAVVHGSGVDAAAGLVLPRRAAVLCGRDA